MGSSDINIKGWFSPNQSVDKKNLKFLGFLRFFNIISNLAGFLGNNSSDLFVKYFCGFFDTPRVSGGVKIVELEFPIHKYFLDSNRGNQPL